MTRVKWKCCSIDTSCEYRGDWQRRIAPFISGDKYVRLGTTPAHR